MTAKTIDTGTNDLLATLDEGVLTLTLNRPDERNAMSGDMNAALQAQPEAYCSNVTAGSGDGWGYGCHKDDGQVSLSP